MRRLRGLYVEDDVTTFKIVERAFRASSILQAAPNRETFMSLITRPAIDFLILDGEIPGWPLADYARELAETTALPLFIYSATPIKKLAPLIALKPKAVLSKAVGAQVLSDAVLSYFYAMEGFMFSMDLPKSS